MKITAIPNETKTALKIPSKFNRDLLGDWLKRYRGFEITPVTNESRRSRGYLEGAVIPEYCKWQYDIDPRDPMRGEQRRFLFKRDFNYEIVNDRDGTPVRIPLSSKGKVAQTLKTYTEWAEGNGAPIPNPKLYKLWRDKYSIDFRFPTYSDFLEFLGLESDAMPSNEHLKMLEQDQDKVEYSEEDIDASKIPF